MLLSCLFFCSSLISQQCFYFNVLRREAVVCFKLLNLNEVTDSLNLFLVLFFGLDEHREAEL